MLRSGSGGPCALVSRIEYLTREGLGPKRAWMEVRLHQFGNARLKPHGAWRTLCRVGTQLFSWRVGRSDAFRFQLFPAAPTGARCLHPEGTQVAARSIRYSTPGTGPVDPACPLRMIPT